MKNLRIKIAIVIVLGIIALFLIFQNRSDTLKKKSAILQLMTPLQ